MCINVMWPLYTLCACIMPSRGGTPTLLKIYSHFTTDCLRPGLQHFETKLGSDLSPPVYVFKAARLFWRLMKWSKLPLMSMHSQHSHFTIGESNILVYIVHCFLGDCICRDCRLKKCALKVSSVNTSKLKKRYFTCVYSVLVSKSNPGWKWYQQSAQVVLT